MGPAPLWEMLVCPSNSPLTRGWRHSFAPRASLGNPTWWLAAQLTIWAWPALSRPGKCPGLLTKPCSQRTKEDPPCFSPESVTLSPILCQSRRVLVGGGARDLALQIVQRHIPAGPQAALAVGYLKWGQGHAWRLLPDKTCGCQVTVWHAPQPLLCMEPSHSWLQAAAGRGVLGPGPFRPSPCQNWVKEAGKATGSAENSVLF